jgi:hypothetical protein
MYPCTAGGTGEKVKFMSEINKDLIESIIDTNAEVSESELEASRGDMDPEEAQAVAREIARRVLREEALLAAEAAEKAAREAAEKAITAK